MLNSFRPVAYATLLAGCLIVTACDVLFVSCTSELRGTIRVFAADSVTGAPVTAGLRGLARDGAFEARLVPVAWDSSLLVLDINREREGNYDVLVQADGYADWTVSNVRVRSDECHVITRDLHARLVPLNADS